MRRLAKKILLSHRNFERVAMDELSDSDPEIDEANSAAAAGYLQVLHSFDSFTVFR